MEVQPSFYANIPAFVRYDEDLKPNAKLLYGEITALTSAKGYCWASNDYFANLYKVDPATVSRWISQLSKKGYISLKMTYKGNTKIVAERKIYLSNSHFMDDEKVIHTDDKKIIHMDDEKVKDINTSFINTNINNMVDSKESTERSNVDIQFDEWWNIYGKKKQKPKAFTAFKKVVKKYGYDELKANTEFFVKNHVKDKQFQPYPSTFLNNYHPDDEDFKNISNQPKNKLYNDYNTKQVPTTVQYNEPDTDTLYSGGDWE